MEKAVDFKWEINGKNKYYFFTEDLLKYLEEWIDENKKDANGLSIFNFLLWLYSKETEYWKEENK